MYPARGSSVCRFHGASAPQSRRAIDRRTEIAQALLDGRPHPAVVFFEMMNMRWYVTEDETAVVCEMPLDQLGGPEVFDELGWVHAWHQVMTYSKLADARYVDKRRTVRQRRDAGPTSGAANDGP